MSIPLAILIGSALIAFAIFKISTKIDFIYKTMFEIYQIMGGEVKSIMEKKKSMEELAKEIGELYKERYKVSEEKAHQWGAQRINAEGYEKALEILKDAHTWPVFDKDIFPNNGQSFKKALDDMIEKERKDR